MTQSDAARRYDDLESEIYRIRIEGLPPPDELDLVLEQAALWPQMTDDEQDAVWRRLEYPDDLELIDEPIGDPDAYEAPKLRRAA